MQTHGEPTIHRFNLAFRCTLVSACALAVGVMGLSLGCDDSKSPTGNGSTTTTSPADRPQSAIAAATSQPVDRSVLQPLTDVASSLKDGPRQRIPLIAVPLTVEVPQGWGVQSGAAGKIVLGGRMTSGDAEILLSGNRPKMKPEALEMLVKDMQQASSQPAGADGDRTVTRVNQRDGMRIIEETQRIGPAGTDPNLTPYRWTVQYIVPSGGLDFSVYEMNVTGISEAMFKADEGFLRSIFDSVKVDPAAMAAATQPVMP